VQKLQGIDVIRAHELYHREREQFMVILTIVFAFPIAWPSEDRDSSPQEALIIQRSSTFSK
jgi:hypothetical protein